MHTIRQYISIAMLCIFLTSGSEDEAVEPLGMSFSVDKTEDKLGASFQFTSEILIDQLDGKKIST